MSVAAACLQASTATAKAAKPSTGFRMIQRKCACGGSSGLTGECEECREKKLVQRRAASNSEWTDIPPIVHEVLRSSGQPLDPATRAFFEPRFGHDFSQVRVHTHTRAAESARAVNALAYTVGRDIVFGAGQYVPETSEGRRLLAHELTHTIQQAAVNVPPLLSVSQPDGFNERQAEEVSRNVTETDHKTIGHNESSARVQRQAPSSSRLAPEKPREVAEDDGVGPEEARKALVEAVGEEEVRQLEQGMALNPEEREAESVAARVAGGGRAPAVSRLVSTVSIQRADPGLVATGAILGCALSFFVYALRHYRPTRNDKWIHCWTSCKIATYCPPVLGDVVALILGGGFEIAEYLTEMVGYPVGVSDLEDFVADAEGVACSFQVTRSCISCCDEARP